MQVQHAYLGCIEQPCCQNVQLLKRNAAMAAFETSRTAPFGAVATYSIVRFFSNIANELVAWNDARVTRNALGKLSDRELDDIGLTRGDIADIALNNRF